MAAAIKAELLAARSAARTSVEHAANVGQLLIKARRNFHTGIGCRGSKRTARSTSALPKDI
jgi:hypothetical protein